MPNISIINRLSGDKNDKMVDFAQIKLEFTKSARGAKGVEEEG